MSPQKSHTPQYRPTVGLEIHVELATASKMFCACTNKFGDPPNTNVCPVCLGMPGVLPVMNRKAYEFAVRVGLALNCNIATYTKWDRKGYYYPDLPKNYQISQYDLPLSSNGYIDLPVDSQVKRVGITRAHLEEDAGKNVHDLPDCTGVDLNRAGVPLLEIVSEPDMNSPQEVMVYARAMRQLVRYLGVSEANMQHGHMRFEPNISLWIFDEAETDGGHYTPIVEVKNLNSFRALEKTVVFEIERQINEWQADSQNYRMDKMSKQNRGWDDVKEITVFQRHKEEAQEYRYFPEPDLLPVEIDEAWLKQIRSQVPELPAARLERFQKEFGLEAKLANLLTSEKSIADYFEQAVRAGASAKRAANMIQSQGLRLANERGTDVGSLGVWPERLAQLCKLADADKVSATATVAIFEAMMESEDSAEKIAQDKNLMQVSDASELESVVQQVLTENTKAVEDYRAGGKKSKKARGFLLGQVMQKSKGQANPKVAGEIIDKKVLG
ncbi:MAG: Asp-tRNA(Asn)/Glu-tRNA(Gln) amidotransferase subunit GatB [Actinobacteria bacterium]|nr:Asp-tRNA(Asn)/Glu-tRNA(Gln) amidotransferase subunit GatB [Actinomycetota bacterium]